MGQENKGGWGYTISDASNPQKIIKEGFGGATNTTNNRMEMTAAIAGLAAVYQLNPKAQITLRSDSELLIKSLRGVFKRNANLDLWQTLEDLTRKFEYAQVGYEWVKGHSGDLGNERADQLANRGTNLGNQAITPDFTSTSTSTVEPEPAQVPPSLNLFTAAVSDNQQSSAGWGYSLEGATEQYTCSCGGLEDTPLLKAEGIALVKGLSEANQYAESQSHKVTVIVHSSNPQVQDTYNKHRDYFDQKFPNTLVEWNIIPENDLTLQKTQEFAQKGLQTLPKDTQSMPTQLPEPATQSQNGHSVFTIQSDRSLRVAPIVKRLLDYNNTTEYQGSTYSATYDPTQNLLSLVDSTTHQLKMMASYQEGHWRSLPVPCPHQSPALSQKDLDFFTTQLEPKLAQLEQQKSTSTPVPVAVKSEGEPELY